MPLLIGLVRRIHHEPSLAELAIETLRLIATNNSQCREAICVFHGIRALGFAANHASLSAKREIAQLFAEVMGHPKQRDRLEREGGLRVLLRFHRLDDPQMRVYTENALSFLRQDNLHIYSKLAKISLETVAQWQRPLPVAPYTLFKDKKRE